jgi:hypothetical protein
MTLSSTPGRPPICEYLHIQLEALCEKPYFACPRRAEADIMVSAQLLLVIRVFNTEKTIAENLGLMMVS